MSETVYTLLVHRPSPEDPSNGNPLEAEKIRRAATMLGLDVDTVQDKLGIRSELEKIENDLNFFNFEKLSATTWRGKARWLAHDANLKELSERYPDVVFELRGWGESEGDWWRKVYTDGRLVKHDIASLATFRVDNFLKRSGSDS